MQIKTIMSYNYLSIRTAKVKNVVTTLNANEDAEKLNHWYTTGGNIICKVI